PVEQDDQEPPERHAPEVQGCPGGRDRLAADRDHPRGHLRDVRCSMAKARTATKKAAATTAAPATAATTVAAPAPVPPAAPAAPATPATMGWIEFVDGVRKVSDGGAIAKAQQMLKKEKFQLFAEVHLDHVTGIVRSQSSATRVYACRLASDGRYSCCTQ